MARSALIMAGGMGTRMSRSGAAYPKAIMPVAGVPMLERNYWQLVRHGFERILVSLSRENSAVLEFVETRLMALARSHDIVLETRIEHQPLGNIGAVQMEAEAGEPLLVVYADNLTCLDLTEIYDLHREKAAAMTLAVHEHPFRMPFGEVRTDGDSVTAYVEKPEYRFLVCSAIMVLAPAAMGAIAPGERLGISDLTRRVLGLGLPVIQYPHTAPWIDVNELADVAAAEAMIERFPAEFACEVAHLAARLQS